MNTNDIVIREEVPTDLVAVRRVHERAFGRRDEAALVDALRVARKATISLVAVSSGQVVGHILFSPVLIRTGSGDRDGLGIGPMAVLPRHQRCGIGSRLVTEGLERCRRVGCPFVVVLGHVAYYPRFGFVPANRFGIRCHYAVPPDAFMALEITAGALDGVMGVVLYQAEFDAVTTA